MFDIKRGKNRNSKLIVSADSLDEVISNINQIMTFLDETLDDYDYYNDIQMHITTSTGGRRCVNLYTFLKKHASEEQLLEFNKNTNYLIYHTIQQLSKLRDNLFIC